jgi:hypothetical protein
LRAPPSAHGQRLLARGAAKTWLSAARSSASRCRLAAAQLWRRCTALAALGMAITPGCCSTQASATCAGVAWWRSANGAARGGRPVPLVDGAVGHERHLVQALPGQQVEFHAALAERVIHLVGAHRRCRRARRPVHAGRPGQSCSRPTGVSSPGAAVLQSRAPCRPAVHRRASAAGTGRSGPAAGGAGWLRRRPACHRGWRGAAAPWTPRRAGRAARPRACASARAWPSTAFGTASPPTSPAPGAQAQGRAPGQRPASALFDEFVRQPPQARPMPPRRPCAGWSGALPSACRSSPATGARSRAARARSANAWRGSSSTCATSRRAGWTCRMAPPGRRPVAAARLAQRPRPSRPTSRPQDDDERFIVGLVLTYYRRHPQRARTRLLDLLGEVLTPAAGPACRHRRRAAQGRHAPGAAVGGRRRRPRPVAAHANRRGTAEAQESSAGTPGLQHAARHGFVACPRTPHPPSFTTRFAAAASPT